MLGVGVLCSRSPHIIPVSPASPLPSLHAPNSVRIQIVKMYNKCVMSKWCLF